MGYFQYNFVRGEDGLPVSRETFMMILVDITAIHIRANYFSPTTEVRSVKARGNLTEIWNQKTNLILSNLTIGWFQFFAMLEMNEIN